MAWCLNRCDEYDYVCNRQCVQKYEFTVDNCPCGPNCLDGCPCPYYDCDEVTTNPGITATLSPTTTEAPVQDVHMLMFNPGWSGTSPFNPNIRFSWYLQSSVLQEEDHVWPMDTPESYDSDRTYMCSFALMGQMWLIGGATTPHSTANPYRQFKVFIDRVEEIHTMPFKLEDGRCLAFTEEEAMACAGKAEKYRCWLFHGETEQWTRTRDTINNHHQGAMARYNDSVVIVGGYEDDDGSTEYYNPVRQQWSWRSNATMFENLYGHTAVSHQDRLYLFGGSRDDNNGTQYAQDKVYKMIQYYWADEFYWYLTEFNLLSPRFNHRTVVQGDIILHVGGVQFQSVEAWIFRPEASTENEKKYLQRHSRFETYNWFSYPEVFLLKSSDIIQPMMTVAPTAIT